MATPQEIAAYYEGHPNPDDHESWDEHSSFEDARSDWEEQHGEPPEPVPVAGPPTPGAGMPAARLGDQTAHGGTIGPVTTGVAATVMIGNKPAACLGDAHICPMFSGPKAHAGGTITKGSLTVMIGGKPAARVSDLTVCSPEPGAIAFGEPTVLIGDLGGAGSAAAATAAGSAVAEANEYEAIVESPETAPEPAQEEYEPPAPAQPGDSVVSVGAATHWIEVELHDEANQPVVGEAYLVTLPDGQEVTGNLDAEGQVRIEGFENPGGCRISFPNLDWAAWGRSYAIP